MQKVEELLARGIIDVRDIPAGELTSGTHQRIRKVTIEGVPELLPGAAAELNALAWPRYYLDFECIQFAIPIWADTRPYVQLPFQWSCHTEFKDGSIRHEEFLDTTGNDPRRAFAEALLEACHETGPIIVYNQTFEKGIIKRLADSFEDLRGSLLALNDRIVDLHPIVMRNYYHPGMKGSWSIKSVLPCLVPELDYSRLGRVQEGTQAQQAYFDLIGDELDSDSKSALRADLLAYCKLDTLAMVEIAHRLQH